jgi:hypothetical protein
MRLTLAFAVVPVTLLIGGAPTPAHHTWTAPVNPCATLTASSLGGYRNLLGKALASAKIDAQRYGRTGAYKVAATNAQELLQRSYDRATAMVDFNQKMPNPNSTTYVEAGNFKTYLQTILTWLPDAAHWSLISASYHRSQPALDAFNLTTDAMERGSQLMRESGRCFVAPYMSGAATAG